MPAMFHRFVSFGVVVCLVGCTTAPTAVPRTQTTVIPVKDPAQYQAVQDAIYPGDGVRVVTHANQVLTFEVTRVDANTLYGSRDRQAYQVPFGDITSIEIQRKVARTAGGSGRGGSSNVHLGGFHGGGGKGAAGLVVLLVVVVVLVAGYWTVKYVYTNVEKAVDALKPPPSAAPEDVFQPAPAP